MKKFLFGCMAFMLALGSVAFTKVEKAPKTDYYWFQFDANDHLMSTTVKPVLRSTDQYGCSGANTDCAQGYGSYTTNATIPVSYSASGAVGPINKKP